LYLTNRSVLLLSVGALTAPQALNYRMKAFALVCYVCVGGLAGCSKLPGTGPTTSQVMEQAAQEPRRFNSIEIDGRVVSVLGSQPAVNLHERLQRHGKPSISTIGIGDRVVVSIWQASGGQVFGPSQVTPENGPGQAAGGPTVVPDQVVGPDGAISVPYAGRVAALGRTPLQIQKTIEDRLAEQIIKPQAIVTVTRAAASNAVTVSGEQITGARVPLSMGGDRLLDVIATAGGSKSPIYETSVRLSRNGQTVTIPMSTLVSDPQENIYVWPEDVITVVQTPKEFSVFGAAFNNSQVRFGSDQLDLAKAIAKAGGLSDSRSDPKGVFLFRFERPAVVNALGIPHLADRPGGGTPVVYHLDLRQVDGYFLAKRFPVADNDIIYVATAQLNELQKFFTLIGTLTGPVIGGAVVAGGLAR